MAIPKVNRDSANAPREIARKLAALDKLQDSLMHLSPRSWEEWSSETNKIHRGRTLPWEGAEGTESN